MRNSQRASEVEHNLVRADDEQRQFSLWDLSARASGFSQTGECRVLGVEL